VEAKRLKDIAEALVMVADTPLSVDRIVLLLGGGDEEPPGKHEVRAALAELQGDYQSRGVELVEVASGFRFQAREVVAPWVNRLWEERRPRYSRALLETVAIIAYRQPITRGEIENIRGVAVSTNIIRTLTEREWVRIVGHRDVPGRPAVYATTRQFLDYFNLKSLSDLPTLDELKDFEDLNRDLFATEEILEPADDDKTIDAVVNEEVDATASDYDFDAADGEGGSPEVEEAEAAVPAVVVAAAGPDDDLSRR
jgi:segregation and condensation protein B